MKSLINRICLLLAKVSGYHTLFNEAVKVIVIMSKQDSKRWDEIQVLRRQLDEQRQEFRAEIEELETRARRNAEHFQAAWSTGLYELCEAEGIYGVMSIKRPYLRPLTERMASQSFDMADCHESGPIFFLKDGKLHPVTAGSQYRSEPDERGEIPFIYATSNLIADGEVVGYVEHTDH